MKSHLAALGVALLLATPSAVLAQAGSKGTVKVGGQALEQLSERQLTSFRRTGIGIVFQQFNLIPTLTARENVELPGMLAGDDAKKLPRHSASCLAQRRGRSRR